MCQRIGFPDFHHGTWGGFRSLAKATASTPARITAFNALSFFQSLVILLDVLSSATNGSYVVEGGALDQNIRQRSQVILVPARECKVQSLYPIQLLNGVPAL